MDLNATQPPADEPTAPPHAFDVPHLRGEGPIVAAALNEIRDLLVDNWADIRKAADEVFRQAEGDVPNAILKARVSVEVKYMNGGPKLTVRVNWSAPHKKERESYLPDPAQGQLVYTPAASSAPD